MKTEVLTKGCVHVNYAVSTRDNRHDLCLVKEHVFLSDGSVKPALRPIKNAKRSWYYTIKQKQNHESKKEWEKKNYLQEYKVNQAQLTQQMAMVLGGRPQGLRKMNRNPFVYGTDITIVSCIKHNYDKQVDAYNQQAESPALLIPTAAYADFEWDIETKLASIGSYVFSNKATLTLRSDIYSKIPDVENKLQELYKGTYLPWLEEVYYHPKNLKTFLKKKLGTKEDYKAKSIEELQQLFKEKDLEWVWHRNWELEIILSNNALDVMRDLYNCAHTDMPDYLTFWNGQADIETTQHVANYYGVDWSTFLTAPDKRIPDEFRNTKWKPSPAEKLDANGNPKKQDFHERWNILENLAAWQYVDLMCLYSTNRMHLPNKPMYTLDYTLQAELGLSKFKFHGMDERLDNLDIEDWHKTMVRDYPLQYAIYALGDVIPMQILDEVGSEIQGQLYPKLGISPIENFKKNPRRLADRFHFQLLDKGYVIGSTSDQMSEELDKNVYAADSWIITLNSTLHDGMSVNCLEGLPDTPTLFIPKVGDGDITSSYPSTARFLNISKTTTYGELFEIDGVREIDARRIGMNISSGKGAAYDVCHEILKYPHFQDWVKLYREG